MKSLAVIPIALTASLLCGAAFGATTVPLNTGYDHSSFMPYPSVLNPTSTTNDSYWINIASYPPTTPQPAASWVLKYPGLPWFPALPSTNWISARQTVASPPGTSSSNPAYTIFRKCFCLLPHFTQPSATFTLRADDTVQVWFNSQLNVMLPPTQGHYNGPVLTSLPSNPSWFHTGRNCIYVLVEDFGGYMGFDLDGTIQANGLMPLPAAGSGQQFQCPCETPIVGSSSRAARSAVKSEDEVVEALKRIAEQRRLERTKKPQ